MAFSRRRETAEAAGIEEEMGSCGGVYKPASALNIRLLKGLRIHISSC